MTPRISNNLTLTLPHSKECASIGEGKLYLNGGDGLEQAHNAYHYVSKSTACQSYF